MDDSLMNVFDAFYSCPIDVYKDLVDTELAGLHDCSRFEGCIKVEGAVVQVEGGRVWYG